jgi:hypothetical protein
MKLDRETRMTMLRSGPLRAEWPWDRVDAGRDLETAEAPPLAEQRGVRNALLLRRLSDAHWSAPRS